MNEPRPATISALPLESRSSVANSWNTRTGSAALSTVTALVRRILRVRAAAAARIIVGAESRNSRRWVFADAEDVEAHVVRKGDCFKQLAEMSRRIDGSTGRINGCRYE